MRKTIGFIGMTVGGGVGWWLGAFVGILTAVTLSAVGTGVGLYAANRVSDEYLP